MEQAKHKTSGPKRVPFSKMTPNQKAAYLFQVLVCICTLGFVFPNIFD